MANERLLWHLVAAERRLNKAMGRLQSAQLLALAGHHYDDVEFDGLVLEYRQAVERRHAARCAVRARRQPLASATGAIGAAPTAQVAQPAHDPLAEPALRLRFAQLLGATGC
jgi:CRISPR/Cas system endoribonuclease Cas6 (RAMP superfamily)